MTLEGSAFQKVRNLVSLRLLFCVALLLATIFLNISRNPSPPVTHLYLLIGSVFLISLVYAILLRKGTVSTRFVHAQTVIDTVIVTAVLVLTGSSDSIFSFLYLIVIVYSSMMLSRNGSFLIAALCAGQYALVVGVHSIGYSSMDFFGEIPGSEAADWAMAAYKISFTSLACFAVSWLSSTLADQSRKSRSRLIQIEEQVRRVEKMAMLGEMAAGLAHEIKNPLASLSGAIQILENDLELKADQARLMRIVLRETERLTELLNRYLLFSKPQAGKIESVNLRRAVEETVEMIKKNTRFKDAAVFEWDIPDGVSIQMDPSHLRQILWNLFLNAVESKPCDCKVQIYSGQVRNQRVEIRIKDNGSGISPEDMAAIFDPFFTTKPHGTGLGLSIVHRILQSSNGQIKVQSDTGQGTVFKLELPAKSNP